jgi:hypothetical protein
MWPRRSLWSSHTAPPEKLVNSAPRTYSSRILSWSDNATAPAAGGPGRRRRPALPAVPTLRRRCVGLFGPVGATVDYVCRQCGHTQGDPLPPGLPAPGPAPAAHRGRHGRRPPAGRAAHRSDRRPPVRPGGRAGRALGSGGPWRREVTATSGRAASRAHLDVAKSAAGSRSGSRSADAVSRPARPPVQPRRLGAVPRPGHRHERGRHRRDAAPPRPGATRDIRPAPAALTGSIREATGS